MNHPSLVWQPHSLGINYWAMLHQIEQVVLTPAPHCGENQVDEGLERLFLMGREGLMRRSDFIYKS